MNNITLTLYLERRKLLLWLVIGGLFGQAHGTFAAEIQAFTSDKCSLFPEGTYNNRKLWCDCCLEHDLAYWRGGNRRERLEADGELYECVFEKTGDKALAYLMYQGVRIGGSPAFPSWYRWGYGWSYGRGYKPLTRQEKQQVKNYKYSLSKLRQTYCSTP